VLGGSAAPVAGCSAQPDVVDQVSRVGDAGESGFFGLENSDLSCI